MFLGPIVNVLPSFDVVVTCNKKSTRLLVHIHCCFCCSLCKYLSIPCAGRYVCCVYKIIHCMLPVLFMNAFSDCYSIWRVWLRMRIFYTCLLKYCILCAPLLGLIRLGSRPNEFWARKRHRERQKVYQTHTSSSWCEYGRTATGEWEQNAKIVCGLAYLKRFSIIQSFE